MVLNVQDLLQEGYIYLANKGNPIKEEGTFSIIYSKYEEMHGSILYKKAYFNAISNIKSFCLGERSGEAYDVNIKTKGTTDEISEAEDTIVFINALSEDNCERQILKFFSENSLNNALMREACETLKVSNEYIQRLFSRLREKLSSQHLELE